MPWNLIRTYADSVVQHAGQAVVGGARLFQIGNRHIQSFQQTVERLETLAVSSGGNDRVLLLRRWLKSLKQAKAYYSRGLANIEPRHNETDESRQPTMVFYQDIDQRGEPVTFLVVFLHSEALEGIALSMIREEPNDEEADLILEIFGHCLIGGKEVHLAILSSIKDLAGVFSCYHEELLMKREELLQFAQSSISGLKISAEQTRIDTEITSLETEIMKEIAIPSRKAHDKSSEELDAARTQALKEALLRVRHYSKLKALLLQRKDLHQGDSPQVYAQKHDKLNILSQSLVHSTSQAQKRIEDHRRRGEEAMSYRLVKVNEVNQVEKDLLVQIGKLKQRKDELEAELRKVNSSLAIANVRVNTVREEKQHFDKANSDIHRHFHCKEQELLRSISLGQTETEVASAWISFIESSWKFQCDFTKQREEVIKAELGKFAQRFESILIQILPPYKDELLVSVQKFEEVVQKLQEMSDDSLSSLYDGARRSTKKRDKLEAEYHDLEGKIQSAFSVVENIKQLLTQSEGFYRWRKLDDQSVDKLIDDLQRVKDGFELIERPYLGVETPTTTRWRKLTKKMASKETRERLDLLELELELHQPQPQQADNVMNKYEQAPVIDGQEFLDSDDELMAFESEFVTVIRDHTVQDLNDWEV